MGKARSFVLKDGMNNLYEPIRYGVLRYFKDNKNGLVCIDELRCQLRQEMYGAK